MASREAQNHYHIYQKTRSNKSYRCIKPTCPHILQLDLLEHREAECPHCHMIFIITKEHLRRKLLHCLKCTVQGKPVETDATMTADMEAFLSKPTEEEINKLL